MSHQISRRDMLGAAALASGAAAGLGVASASGAAPTAPTSPLSKQSNGFALRKQEPQVVRHGGSITHADAASCPVLEGNRGSAALMRVDPGGLREPHWHPDCWEMEVPLRGTGTLGVVNPDGTWSQQKLGPGDIGFIPQGFAHY